MVWRSFSAVVIEIAVAAKNVREERLSTQLVHWSERATFGSVRREVRLKRHVTNGQQSNSLSSAIHQRVCTFLVVRLAGCQKRPLFPLVCVQSVTTEKRRASCYCRD